MSTESCNIKLAVLEQKFSDITQELAEYKRDQRITKEQNIKLSQENADLIARIEKKNEKNEGFIAGALFVISGIVILVGVIIDVFSD